MEPANSVSLTAFIDRALTRGPAVRAIIAHPLSAPVLAGIVETQRAGLITATLVGPLERLRALADAEGVDLSAFELVDAEHSHASADKAVALVREGRGQILIKGSLHTEELLHAVVNRDTGLRTERRISHAYVMAAAFYHKPYILTDAAINIAPDLATKADICRNAIELAHTLGVALPKLAILSAEERVTPRIPSTIEAAALCKMAERGQISGALLDGPLAFDNAFDRAAAITKGIHSEVAGDADIVLVPDLEAGNMLAKQMTYMRQAQVAGIVLGARVPIVLTSRSADTSQRLLSTALAALLHHRRFEAVVG